MNILGLSAFYHDSAACLVQEGRIVAAAEEERFTRIKHDSAFPENAVQYCLREGGIDTSQLDLVVFYEKPWLKFERLLESHLAFVPQGYRAFLQAMPRWLKRNLWIKDTLAKKLRYSGKVLFPEHHESHAAASFYPSPFADAAILTLDGVGEWATTSFGIGRGSQIQLDSEIHFPHSLGLLYSAFTAYAGFKVNSGEYKLMGLAPYGQPKYVTTIRDHLIDFREDGSFRLNMQYFDFGAGLSMTNRKFHNLFAGPPRIPESAFEPRIYDLARSIQEVLEEAVLRLARHVHRETKLDNLCLGGGVALNCVANGRLLREGPYRNIWIQPAAGDAGGALGAALWAWHQYQGNPRSPNGKGDAQKGSLLGPAFTPNFIRAFLDQHHIPYDELSPADISEWVADRLHAQEVIGWFQGRMEFGPRALGGRSILGDARNPRMKEIVNEKVKLRESFRPFAVSILKEKIGTYFKWEADSPYMLFVAQLNENGKALLPAIRHLDDSARVQTVDGESQPAYRKLLLKMEEKYGCPALLNTSFNVRGEPMVGSPKEAYTCFRRTGIDSLVLENFVLVKTTQHPPWDLTQVRTELD